MSTIEEPIAVAVSGGGLPDHLIWRSRHFRVSDTPTVIPGHPDLFWDAALTHPPTGPTGWRVQGTTDDGETRVFDIALDGSSARWRLLHVWI